MYIAEVEIRFIACLVKCPSMSAIDWSMTNFD